MTSKQHQIRGITPKCANCGYSEDRHKPDGDVVIDGQWKCKKFIAEDDWPCGGSFNDLKQKLKEKKGCGNLAFHLCPGPSCNSNDPGSKPGSNQIPFGALKEDSDSGLGADTEERRGADAPFFIQEICKRCRHNRKSHTKNGCVALNSFHKKCNCKVSGDNSPRLDRAKRLGFVDKWSKEAEDTKTLSDKIQDVYGDGFIHWEDVKDFIAQNDSFTEEEGKSVICENTFKEGFEYAISRMKSLVGERLI